MIEERILEAAAELFLTRGYNATTMADVVDATKISKTTLYARFRDKQELFDSAGEKLLERGLPQLQEKPEIDGQALPEINITRFALSLFSDWLAPDALALRRLILCEGAQLPQVLAACNAYDASVQDQLRQLLTTLCTVHRITRCDPVVGAQAFLLMLEGLRARILTSSVTPDAHQLAGVVLKAAQLALKAGPSR